MSSVVVNAVFLQPGRVGGAEFMCKNLVDGLLATRPPGERLVVAAREKWPTGENEPEWIPASGQRSRFIEESVVMSRLRNVDALLNVNYHCPPVLGRPRRVVSVIHDVNYRVFPEQFSPAKCRWLSISHRHSLNTSDAVVAISQFTRDQLIETYGRRFSDRIHVVHNPISWERFGQIADPTTNDGGERWVLSIASHYRHKNLGTLIAAFELMADEMADVRLALIGQVSSRLKGVVGGEDIAARVASSRHADKLRVLGYIDDRSVGDWLRRSSVFAFPSLYEGFGMPAVEALGMGIPVVTTARAAIPEVTMGEATYVSEPLKAEAWAEALSKAVQDGGRVRGEIVEQVRSAYSPTTIARRYRGVMMSEGSEAGS